MSKSLLAILLMVFACAGCSISDRVSYGDSEGAIPATVIKTIKAKKAQKSWVIANLGQPFSVDSLHAKADRPHVIHEVYNYRFEKTQIRSGHLLFLLKAGGREDTVEYFHVAFDGDKVSKAWIDKLPRPPLGERSVKQTMLISSSKENTPDIVDNDNRFAWKLPILKKWFSKPDKKESSTADAKIVSDKSDFSVVEKVMPPKNLAPPAAALQGTASSKPMMAPKEQAKDLMLTEPEAL